MTLMNTPHLIPVALACLALAACGDDGQTEADAPAEMAAQTVATGTISVSGGWVRAVPEGARMSAGYGVIANQGDMPERIVSLASSLAETVELHESREENGRSMMRPVPDLEIPAGGEIALQPGGYHLMLIGVREPIVAGETYDVTVTFETSGTLTIPMTAMSPSGAQSMDHDGH